MTPIGNIGFEDLSEMFLIDYYFEGIKLPEDDEDVPVAELPPAVIEEITDKNNKIIREIMFQNYM